MVVLMFYAVALTAAATIGAAVLGTAAFFLTKTSPNKKRAIVASVLFPYACVAFAGAWFVGYAVINETAFHRDPMLGDSWQTPLPNGYALMMIDTTDQGTVYNPRTQGGYGSLGSSEDSEFGVRQLQVSGGLMFGARDSGDFSRIGESSTAVDTYFELNTASNRVVEFKTIAELRTRAAEEGITLNLRPFESVFGDYRTTWFDYAAGAVLLLVPLIAFGFLARWIWRIHQGSVAAPA